MNRWTPPPEDDHNRGLSHISTHLKPEVMNAGMAGNIHVFETRQRGNLRTFGVLLNQPDRLAADFSAFELPRIARLALSRHEASARGKIAILGADGLLVLQADSQGGILPALCGNATAAAAHLMPQAEGELTLIEPGGDRYVSAYVRTGARVMQSWKVKAPVVTEFTWRGRSCVRVEGLNSYVVVIGNLPGDMTAEVCMANLMEGRPNAKMAVLEHGALRGAVAFHNISGRHGAAPFTGLASLAIAASAVPEVAAHFGDSMVTFQTSRGLETRCLPIIDSAPDGYLRIELPGVEACLTQVPWEALQ